MSPSFPLPFLRLHAPDHIVAPSRRWTGQDAPLSAILRPRAGWRLDHSKNRSCRRFEERQSLIRCQRRFAGRGRFGDEREGSKRYRCEDRGRRGRARVRERGHVCFGCVVSLAVSDRGATDAPLLVGNSPNQSLSCLHRRVPSQSGQTAVEQPPTSTAMSPQSTAKQASRRKQAK